MMLIYSLLFLITFALSTLQAKFVIPDVSVQAIKPKGLVVSLPDTPGVQLFAFHGNVNQPIKGKEEGTISKDTSKAVDGLWQIKDPNVELKVGDVIYYWIFVQHNRLGFDKQEQKFTVAALVDEGTSTSVTTGSTENCQSTATTINGGQVVCGQTLIFEDNFDNLDDSKWQKQLYIANEPDFEFVSYEPQNILVSNGAVNLVANLRPNVLDLNVLDFTNGCTGKVCVRDGRGKLLPPIIAGQLKSKFSFRYGKIEIKAQLPQGDWIFPQLYLESKDNSYGEAYKSGRMWLAYARGNTNLRNGGTQEQIGNSLLFCGPVLSTNEPERSSTSQAFNSPSGNWGDQYHTFTITWKPDGISVAVDGNERYIRTPFSSLSVPYASSWPNQLAPFDKEFLVTLGIAAGGHSDFPDRSTSGSSTKPWKRTNAQDTTAFYNKRSNWLPTWQNDRSTLKVDYIRIWSL